MTNDQQRAANANLSRLLLGVSFEFFAGNVSASRLAELPSKVQRWALATGADVFFLVNRLGTGRTDLILAELSSAIFRANTASRKDS